MPKNRKWSGSRLSQTEKNKCLVLEELEVTWTKDDILPQNLVDIMSCDESGEDQPTYVSDELIEENDEIDNILDYIHEDDDYAEI